MFRGAVAKCHNGACQAAVFCPHERHYGPKKRTVHPGDEELSLRISTSYEVWYSLAHSLPIMFAPIQ